MSGTTILRRAEFRGLFFGAFRGLVFDAFVFGEDVWGEPPPSESFGLDLSFFSFLLSFLSSFFFLKIPPIALLVDSLSGLSFVFESFHPPKTERGRALREEVEAGEIRSFPGLHSSNTAFFSGERPVLFRPMKVWTSSSGLIPLTTAMTCLLDNRKSAKSFSCFFFFFFFELKKEKKF